MKKCLLFSIGPIPSNNYPVAEGGGLRCRGLAQGLIKNGHEVTVATQDIWPQAGDENDLGVEIINWSLDDKNQFSQVIKSYDAIIISYCAGTVTDWVVECIPDNVQLILDCYVPIYVEVSARDSKDKNTEYYSYNNDIISWGRAIGRGDLILCASSSQKEFYMGVLSALGRINPLTYSENIIIVVPFGVDEHAPKINKSPIRSLEQIKKNDFVVLWFGGLYPWFSIIGLIKALEHLQNKVDSYKYKLVVVGGKNPFNNHPDFVSQYRQVLDYCNGRGIIDKYVFFKDWVDYQDRFDWYNDADVIISLNKPGNENRLSWRTRVMDYVWGGRPIITNGGDPLSEYLIKNEAALRIDDLDPVSIASKIQNLDPFLLNNTTGKLKFLRSEFLWSNVTKELSILIEKKYRPSDIGFDHSIVKRLQTVKSEIA